MRSIFLDSQQHKKHNIAAGIIAVALLINSVVVFENMSQFGIYYILFLICAVLDVISHALKESLIRSMPLDQSKFNLNIAVSQLIVGVLITPIILGIAFKYEKYGSISALNESQQQQEFGKFLGYYISYGFKCAFDFSSSSSDFEEQN